MPQMTDNELLQKMEESIKETENLLETSEDLEPKINEIIASILLQIDTTTKNKNSPLEKQR